MRHTYTVETRRSGRWWAIDIPEVKGVFSQARRISEVEPMARDAIATMLDVSPRSFDVVVKPMLGERLQRVVEAARSSRIVAQEAQMSAAENAARALQFLHRSGLPLRDAGDLLGMSHQRAAQIMNADPRGFQAHRRKAIAELRAGYHLGGGPLPRREDVYDRK